MINQDMLLFYGCAISLILVFSALLTTLTILTKKTYAQLDLLITPKFETDTDAEVDNWLTPPLHLQRSTHQLKEVNHEQPK